MLHLRRDDRNSKLRFRGLRRSCSPLSDVGHLRDHLRRRRRSVGLNQSLARMGDLQRLRKNCLAGMKRVRSAARQRFGRITCGTGLRMVSRQGDRTKILRWNIGQFDSRHGQTRLGVGQKSPDGQQQDGYDDDVPDKRRRECTAGQRPLNPLDAELRILRGVCVLGGARAVEIIAHAGAELFPGRFPVHSQIEAGKARVHGKLFH